MTTRRPNLTSTQGLVFLLLCAIATGAVLFAVLPVPASGFERARTVAEIAGLDALLFGGIMIWVHSRAERAAEAERTALKHQLAESERLASVGRVAAGIAHEIGNPLTGIANYAHLLRGHTGRSADAATALTGIEREVDRIDRIVGSLLDYARPRRRSQPAAFDGASALRQAVQLLAAQGALGQVAVQTAIEPSPLGLTGNSHELEQVFVNLLLNAIEAMQAKGTISVYAGRLTPDTIMRAPRRSGDAANASTKERRVNPRLDEWRARHKFSEPCAKFVVADSGPGVTPEQADRIFDPFFTTKSKDDGSGLGLAIVERVIESHDGVVWVQRAREGGAAFHMVLPLKAVSAVNPSLVA